MSLPVTTTVQTTYTFVAQHITTLLRLTWLPLFINALAGVWTSLELMPYVTALTSKDPQQFAAAAGPAAGWVALGLIVPLTMSAVAGVAVLRFVVNGDDAPSDLPVVHVAFGLPELRVIAVTALIFLMLFLLSIPMSIVLGGATAVSGSSIIAVIGMTAFIFILIVVAARWLMAYPVAAIEGKINFERAWQLIRPYYGSFVGFLLLLWLPLLVLDFLTDFLVAPHGVRDMAALRVMMAARWPVLTGAEFFVNFVANAVFFTALGVVYRIATQKPVPGVKQRRSTWA
jgi:hypothetical protein